MPELGHVALLRRSPEERARRAVVHAHRLHNATKLAITVIFQRRGDVLGEDELLALLLTLIEKLKRELDATRQYVRDVRVDRDGARARSEQQPGHGQARAAYDKLQQHFDELAQMYSSAVSFYHQLLHVLQAPRVALDT